MNCCSVLAFCLVLFTRIKINFGLTTLAWTVSWVKSYGYYLCRNETKTKTLHLRI